MHKFMIPLLFWIVFSSFVNSNRPAVSTHVFSGDSLNVSSDTRFLKAFELSMISLYDEMKLDSLGLAFHVFRGAMTGYYNLSHEGKVGNKQIITIIDFTLPGTERRFFCIDLDNREVLFHTLVAHGRNSGGDYAEQFSNKPSSNQSSIGFYLTGETYMGANGYSLRLDGLDAAWNSNLRRRAVVVHGADYATQEWIDRYGRLGRSYGCPAVPIGIANEIIDTIKGNTLMFAYYNDEHYLSGSALLDEERAVHFFSLDAGRVK